MESTISNTLLLTPVAIETSTETVAATDDFDARVKAEALRRLEVQRFEDAVTAEMRRLTLEQELAKQPALYRKLHESRKADLRKMFENGQILRIVFEIETDISDLVIGNLDEEAFYTKVASQNYLYYYERAMGRFSLPKSYAIPAPRPGVPRELQMYVDFALGRLVEGPMFAKQLFERFNDLSVAKVYDPVTYRSSY